MNVDKEKDKYFVNVIFFLLYGKLQSFFFLFFYLINCRAVFSQKVWLPDMVSATTYVKYLHKNENVDRWTSKYDV